MKYLKKTYDNLFNKPIKYKSESDWFGLVGHVDTLPNSFSDVLLIDKEIISKLKTYIGDLLILNRIYKSKIDKIKKRGIVISIEYRFVATLPGKVIPDIKRFNEKIKFDLDDNMNLSCEYDRQVIRKNKLSKICQQ